MKLASLLLASVLLCCGHARADAPSTDPLESARWDDMRKSFFDGQQVVFDARVQVTGPLTAENPMNVPVAVNASGLPGVRQVIVFADFNPIVRILDFTPGAADASLAFRMHRHHDMRRSYFERHVADVCLDAADRRRAQSQDVGVFRIATLR